MTQMHDLNVALVGCGTVGTGVVRILQTSTESLQQRTGRSIKLRRVVVQNVEKRRDVDFGHVPLSNDIDSVINDPQIHLVIHVLILFFKPIT